MFLEDFLDFELEVVFLDLSVFAWAVEFFRDFLLDFSDDFSGLKVFRIEVGW